MKLTLLILLAALSGCSAMPSMRYCDTVEYTRVGNLISIHAECTAQVGGSLPKL